MQNNPDIQDWMTQQDPEIRSMPALEEHFERSVLDLAAAAGRSYIVWQEILDNRVKVTATLAFCVVLFSAASLSCGL